MLKLSPADLDAAAQHLWQLLIKGTDELEAQDKMCLDAATFKRVKTHMLDEKAQAIRELPVEHVYVQYILDQAHNIKELTTMIKEFGESKQYNAMVGAIRLRSDLHDRILTKGQECGVIHRQPERKEVVAGVLVADLNNNQLRGTLQRELSAITRLMSDHGEQSFLDVDPGAIHHGPALPAVTEAKPEEAEPEPPPKKRKRRGKTKQRVDP